MRGKGVAFLQHRNSSTCLSGATNQLLRLTSFPGFRILPSPRQFQSPQLYAKRREGAETPLRVTQLMASPLLATNMMPIVGSL